MLAQPQSLLKKLLPSLLPRPITSSSSTILYSLTLLVIPPDTPSGGVSQCNSTNSNGIIPIYKRWVSVLVPLKANIFYLTSKNLQPALSTSLVFITLISCPLDSQQPHSFQNMTPLEILTCPLGPYCSQPRTFPSTLQPCVSTHCPILSQCLAS